MGHFLQKVKNQNTKKIMKLFSILALATASHAYTAFVVDEKCDENTPCVGDNETCDAEKLTCACLPGYGSADGGKDCKTFTCTEDLCNKDGGGKCNDTNDACDCAAVEACKPAEGSTDPVCDVYCAPLETPETTTGAAVDTTTAQSDGVSAFATLSAVAMAIIFA